MNNKQMTAALITACALFMPWNSCDAAVIQDTAQSITSSPSSTDHIYRQDGLVLRVPRAYTDLLLLQRGENNPGQLFSIAERGSVEAAQKESPVYEGAGWLFAIGKVSAEELHEMLCMDMTGRELFAQDEQGSYYIFYHPTDVRYMRETPAAMKRDQEIWSSLCNWAWQDVRKNFLADNNLLSLQADNSAVGIYLARTIYKPAPRYSLKLPGKKKRTGNTAQATPFVNMLLYGNTYEMIQKAPQPQGKAITLTLPREKATLDFFQADGATYVRERRPGLRDNYYKSVPLEEHAEAWSVLQDWYDTLKNVK